MSQLKSFKDQRNILGLSLLQPFLPKKTYLPYTSSSFSFESIQLVANDIVVNSRHKIVEFGSGISTIVLGAILDSLNADVKLLSIDEDADWINLIDSILKKEGINSVQLQHLPLRDSNDTKYPGWYNTNNFDLSAKIKPDLIIVDGPSAWQKNRESVRKYALDYLLETNAIQDGKYAIYLDDCNRKGEKSILSEWGKTLKLKPQLITESLGRITAGTKYNSI